MEIATIRSGAQARASQTIDEAFPKTDPLITPLGNQVLVQLRNAKNRTAGGIDLVDESKDFDSSMIRVAQVLAMGPIAYKNRNDFSDWPEGAWVKIGDYVRVPAYAGTDSWRIFVGEAEEMRGTRMIKVPVFAKFAMLNDYDMKGLIKGDPLEVIDYI